MNTTAVRYFIAVNSDPAHRTTILACAHYADRAYTMARDATGVLSITVMECTKELFERVEAGDIMSWDDTGPIADVNVSEYDVDTVVEFVSARMIHAADRGKLIVESLGAVEELRPYAVPLHPDMARNQELYGIVELLQSTALHAAAIAKLDAWIEENSERPFHLIGSCTPVVHATVWARNVKHALAAGEDVDADEDLVAVSQEDMIEKLHGALVNAHNLSTLAHVLRQIGYYLDNVEDLEAEDIYSESEIPKFGGTDRDVLGVVSWDKSSMLVGMDGWTILPRAEAGPVQRVVLLDANAGR